MQPIYDTYAPALYGLILKVENNESEACVILQRVFIEHAKNSTNQLTIFVQLVRCMVKVLLEQNKINRQQIGSLIKSSMVPTIAY
jgi:hypothetical protein